MQGAPLQDVAVGVATGVALQVALAAPFLAVAPGSYFSRAFEFSRCAFVVHACIHFAPRCSHASQHHSTRTHPALHCSSPVASRGVLRRVFNGGTAPVDHAPMSLYS